MESTIKSDARGYVFLGKLPGCPDLSKMGHASVIKTGTHVEIKLSRAKEHLAMLKRGYINIGKCMEAKVDFTGNHISIDCLEPATA